MKKETQQYYKIISIPHLKSTLYIQDMSKLKGISIKGGGFTTRVVTGNPYNTRVCIFFTDVKETVKLPENYPMIAHEIMHFIQIICQDYGMQIEEEREHTAYLMSYLLEEITK